MNTSDRNWILVFIIIISIVIIVFVSVDTNQCNLQMTNMLYKLKIYDLGDTNKIDPNIIYISIRKDILRNANIWNDYNCSIQDISGEQLYDIKQYDSLLKHSNIKLNGFD